MHITILPYQALYQQGVLDLILDIQQNEFSIPITIDQQPDLTNIEKYYQTRSGNFWIALHNDTVIGTISILDIGNKQGALRKMFVHKEYRGHKSNTAQLLLDYLLEWCSAKSILHVFLGTTVAFKAAHRFYEKNKFIRIERNELPVRFPIMEVDTIFYVHTF